VTHSRYSRQRFSNPVHAVNFVSAHCSDFVRFFFMLGDWLQNVLLRVSPSDVFFRPECHQAPNVHISIAALAIGSTAAVASVFGMNLIARGAPLSLFLGTG